jgi:hypothetical protein
MGLWHLDVGVALADVTRRLAGSFSPRIPESVVAATVRRFAAQWQDARVTEFVPLLVERRSAEHLRTLLLEVAAPGDGDAAAHTEGFSQVA